MYKHTQDALYKACNAMDSLFIGYSNTASIMRLLQQAGAQGCTSPDEITKQDKKAQAVWVISAIERVCSEEEALSLLAYYGRGGVASVASQAILVERLDYLKLGGRATGQLLSNICTKKPTMMQTMDSHDVPKPTAYRWRKHIDKMLREWQTSGQQKLEAELERYGLLKHAA